MTQSASMDLLTKGASQAAVVESPADDTVEIDIDVMTAEQIDALVEDNALPVPDDFKGFDLAAKRAYLTEHFGGDSEEEAPVGDAAIGDAITAIATAVTPEKNGLPLPVEATAKGTKGAKAPKEPKPAKEPKAPKAEKKAKATAVSTEVAKTGEIVEPDVFQDLVHEIENLKEKDALSTAEALIDQPAQSFFKLGGVLTKLQANGWHGPFATFAEYCENKLGIKLRRAGYYMQIYNALANSGIPHSVVAGIGWTKLAMIAPLLTQENVDSWVATAKSQNYLTLVKTVDTAKKAAKGLLSSDQGSEDSGKVTSLTFKPHADQLPIIESALEKAKDASSTPHQTVALTYICMEYLGGVSLTERLKTVGYEKALEAVAAAFPEWDFTLTPAGASDDA